MKLIVQCVTLVALLALVIGDDSCNGPFGVGRCVLQKDCKDKSISRRSVPGRKRHKQGNCGSKGSKHLICCPIHSTNSTTDTSMNPTLPKNNLVVSSGTFGSTTTITTTTTTAHGNGTTTTRTTTTTMALPSSKCTTLEGSVGTCVKWNTCQNVVEKLKTPTDESLDYVYRSRCIGSATYSVCCEGSTSDAKDKSPQQQISVRNECSPSPDLPDPNGECCGREVTSLNRTSEGQASIYQYPWMVIIDYEVEYPCVGALISSIYVLTAVQCIVDHRINLPRKIKSVRLGEYNITNPGPDCVKDDEGGLECTGGPISIPVVSTVIHPAYSSRGFKNDIALIKLGKMAPYNGFIRPICLPTSDITKSPPADLRFFIAGWGAKDDENEYSDVKLHTDVPYVQEKRCSQVYEHNRALSITDDQICAGGEVNVGSCRGDGGGPLMYFDGKKFEVSGVTSYGRIECGGDGKPSVYTKVLSYVQWIEHIVKTL